MNPDHCFVATASESGEQDAREKEMEENMNEVTIIRITIMSRMIKIIIMTVIPLKVSATIVNLRNMANDIGNVTKAQNEMLNR